MLQLKSKDCLEAEFFLSGGGGGGGGGTSVFSSSGLQWRPMEGDLIYPKSKQ